MNFEKKKYAVCIWGQLRAIDVIINNFNDFLINTLNADLFLLVQKTDTSIDNNIDLLKTNNKFIYESSDVTKTFLNYDKLEKKNNYLLTAYLNVYENLYKINDLFGEIFEKNYNYIILTRSDYLHLFPFPNILNFNVKHDIFWVYDGHDWGGINNTLICVPSKYIKEYLCCAYNFLQDSNNINILNSNNLNTEKFFQLIFDKNNWKTRKIQPSAFLTASNYSEISTYGSIKLCPKRNVYYKYHRQLLTSWQSLKQYNNNHIWTLYNNNIILQCLL